MISTTPAIIWTSGPDHVIDFLNEYAHVFTEGTMQDLAGDRWADLIHPEDLESQRRGYLEGVKTRQSFQLEYRLRRADGEYRWMLDKGTPRFLPNGDFAGYVGAVFDITDAKLKQEQAFREKNLENLKVLSMGIAHDFNTLLGAIFGEVDLALTDMPVDSPGRENIERIDAVAKRAVKVVRLLLAYVGGQSGSAPLELVDLVSVVEEVVPHLKPSIPAGVEIRTSLAQGLPSIRANLGQIRLVLLNLIINGVEALQGERGLVTVTTAPVDLPLDSADGDRPDLPEGQYIKLGVSDTGRGMTDDMRNRIFDPYYTAESMGKGLGLSAVHGIMRSHRGAITCRALPGSGSLFELLLPVAPGRSGGKNST